MPRPGGGPWGRCADPRDDARAADGGGGEGPPAARDPAPLPERGLPERRRRVPELALAVGRRLRGGDPLERRASRARRAQGPRRQGDWQTARLHHGPAVPGHPGGRSGRRVQVLWNVDYAYYTGGNSRNLVLLAWVGR